MEDKDFIEESLPLFSGCMDHPLNQLPFIGQKRIIAKTLDSFRNFQMCSGGFSEEYLRFYDGVLGSLIRTRDEFVKINHPLLSNPQIKDFIEKWEYHGDIYRVIDKSMIYPKKGEPYYRMPAVKWHGMIASWSSSFDFTTNFNHMNNESRYTIIHANTGESVGIDVNRFTKYLNCNWPQLEGEREVIFPMKSEFVIHVYKKMTLPEFKELMESKVRIS